MSITVRRLTAGDELGACKLASTFKSARVTPEHAARFLSNPGHFLFVAEVSGEIVGFLLAYRLERLDRAATQLFVYEVEVAPSYRRQGVGTRLMERVGEAVEREGMMEAFVIADADNAAAVALYGKTGGRRESGSSVVLVYPGRAG